MRFWDSSALVPLLVEEASSASLAALAGDSREIAVWWAGEVECASAIARLRRMGHLTPSLAQTAFERLDGLSRTWVTIDPLERIRSSARRFLRVHDLRAADALQLAAAFAASEGEPSTLEIVCLDDRLTEAARREGFRVIDRSGLP